MDNRYLLAWLGYSPEESELYHKMLAEREVEEREAKHDRNEEFKALLLSDTEEAKFWKNLV